MEVKDGDRPRRRSRPNPKPRMYKGMLIESVDNFCSPIHIPTNPNMPPVERKRSDRPWVTPCCILTPEIAARAYRPEFRLNPRVESIGENLNPSSVPTTTGNNVEMIRHSLLNMDFAKPSESEEQAKPSEEEAAI